MRWFRKNSKKILVVAGVFLMIGFLLPSVSSRRQREKQDGTYGYVSDGHGGVEEIQLSQIRNADSELKVLRMLDMPQFLSGQIFARIPELGGDIQRGGGIGQMVGVGLHALLFPENQFNRQVRASLYQQAGSWASGQESLEGLIEAVDKLTSSESNSAAQSYWLLSREAAEAGFYATSAQVDALLAVRGQLMREPSIRLAPLQMVKERAGISEGDVRRFLARFISVIQYTEALTGGPEISEAELKKTVSDILEFETVDGDYVTFSGEAFLQKVPEPTVEQLEGHFAEYKSVSAGAVREDNPHGFGYKLPDRVQVEYLRVDLTVLGQEVGDSFEAMSVTEQEEVIQGYWQLHREMWREPVAALDDSEGMSERQFRDPPLDEIYDTVKSAWQDDEARSRGESLALTCRDMVDAASDGHGDYAAVAAKISEQAEGVTFGKSDFLSVRQAQAYLEFGQTYLMRGNEPERALMEMIFSCRPLKASRKDRFDTEPTELYEDLGPLVGFDSSGGPAAIYLVRAVDADKSREAVSLADDGRQGGADAAGLEPAESLLYQQVKTNWQRLEASGLAQAAAEQFASASASGWGEALAQANEAVKDPCQAAGPFYESNLGKVRERVKSYQEMIQENAKTASFLRPRIDMQMLTLRKAMELAQERRVSGESEGAAILPNPSQFNVWVFRNLAVTPPTEAAYLRQKPSVARELMSHYQGPLVLAQLNPDNIVRRAGFEPLTDEEGAVEEE